MEDAFETTAQVIGGQPVILILDEFSYARRDEPSLASHLQAAWDHLLQEHQRCHRALRLPHRNDGRSDGLLRRTLYGRFTAELPVDPLSFSALHDFLPRYTAAERVAVYAVAGGVPAYLERFDGRRSLTENIRELFMQRTSIFPRPNRLS